MTDKILATFRLDPDIWQAFQTKAKDNRTNASRLLVEFVESFLANPSARSNPTELEQRLARVENQLTKLLSEVDERIERTVGQQPVQAHASPSQLAELRQQLMTVEAERDELRQQLVIATRERDKYSQQLATAEMERVKYSQRLADTEAERTAARPQESAPTPPNYEAIARKVLDSLNVGRQSADYKTAVKVLTQFVTEVKGASSTRTVAGPTASKLVSDAVVAHGVRFDVLRDVAEKLGFELDKHAGSYRVKKDQAVLFEAEELTAIAAWLRNQPLPID